MNKIEDIKILTFFVYFFFLKILLHKMSKSSFFYQAETLHGCEKFKKSTGSQSSIIIASKMANIFTFENLWGGPQAILSYTIFGCFSVLLKALMEGGESRRGLEL